MPPRASSSASCTATRALFGEPVSVRIASASLLRAASGDHSARVWNASTGECLHVLAGHTDEVGSAAFSPDGLLAVTTSRDKTARVWNATSGACVHELRGHTDGVLFAAFSPDGKLIATAGLDPTARLWDAATGKPVAELKGHGKGINGIA